VRRGILEARSLYWFQVPQHLPACYLEAQLSSSDAELGIPMTMANLPLVNACKKSVNQGIDCGLGGQRYRGNVMQNSQTNDVRTAYLKFRMTLAAELAVCFSRLFRFAADKNFGVLWIQSNYGFSAGWPRHSPCRQLLRLRGSPLTRSPPSIVAVSVDYCAAHLPKERMLELRRQTIERLCARTPQPHPADRSTAQLGNVVQPSIRWYRGSSRSRIGLGSRHGAPLLLRMLTTAPETAPRVEFAT
jgi:hypothetical protein